MTHNNTYRKVLRHNVATLTAKTVIHRLLYSIVSYIKTSIKPGNF